MTPSSQTETFVFTEEVLGRIMNLVLTTKRQMLIENLDPRQYLLTDLQQCRVLGRRESEEIKSACSRSVYEGAEKLLDTLMTKGPIGYDRLCKALLNDRTQLHLLGALNACLELFKYNYRKYVEQEESLRQFSEQSSCCESQKQKRMSDHHPTKTTAPHSANIVYPPKYLNTHHLSTHSNPPTQPAHRARSPMPSEDGFTLSEPNIDYSHVNFDPYASTQHQPAFPQTCENGPMQVGFDYVGTVGYYPQHSYNSYGDVNCSYYCGPRIEPGPQSLNVTGNYQHPRGIPNHVIDIPCGQQGN